MKVHRANIATTLLSGCVGFLMASFYTVNQETIFLIGTCFLFFGSGLNLGLSFSEDTCNKTNKEMKK